MPCVQVQRRLQLRIEAQGKYLTSMLEKAFRALNEQAVREGLSEAHLQMPSVSDATTNTVLAHFGNCTIDGTVSQSAMKKRQRPFFGSGELIVPLDGNTRQEVEWMTNIG